MTAGRAPAAIALAALIFAAVAIGALAARQDQDSGGPTEFKVDKQHSYLLAVTGKSGLFSFAAHRHAVLAQDWHAEVKVAPDKFSQSSVYITVPVASLVIDSTEARRQAELGSSPSASDVRAIQQRMLSPEVLDPHKYLKIEFRSTGIEAKSPGELQLTGELTLHGQAHPVQVPVHYKKLANGGYDFSATFNIRQTKFGMTPATVAGGTVKVKDEVKIVAQLSLVPAK